MIDPTTEHAALIESARMQVERARLRTPSNCVSRDGSMFLRESPLGYQLLRVLHRGGQGTVYQAIQGSTGRTVAVKVMRDHSFGAGGENARFQREVHILSQLDHPNIVRIIDSGVLDEHHYFVMDFIDGVAFDRFCSQLPSIEKRLALFASVCDAVHAAHLRGVIHRDLKPGNILVDRDSRPHVLDFGLAKRFTLDGSDTASMAVTQTGQFLGSLPWASPEQVSSDASDFDLRSDVYSLGVILYQILTGHFPYRVIGSIRDVTDNILSSEPIRPGTLSRAVDADLETIVLRALNKEPGRRYQSAGDFARDIRHYLSGEIIEARRDSLPYVLRKQLQRHWIPASVAAAFVLIISAGLVITVSLWRAAAAQRDLKESQRIRAESINSVLHNMLASAGPEIAQGKDVTVAQVLGQTVHELDGGALRGYPDVETSVRLTLGEVYLSLGRFDEAERQLAKALQLADEDHEANRFEAALCRAAVGRLYRARGEYEKAEQWLNEALTMAIAAGGESRPQTPVIMMALASVLSTLERHDQVGPLHSKALELTQKIYGENHPETARLKIEIATHRLGGERSVELLREELNINRATLGARHPQVVHSLRQLAAELHLKGQYEESERTYLETLALTREIYGEHHAETIQTVLNLRWLYVNTNQRAKVVPLLNEYEDSAAIAYGANSVRFAEYLNVLGTSLMHETSDQQAQQVFERALAILRNLGSDQGWQGAESRNELAHIHLRKSDFEVAERFARETLAIEEKSERMEFRQAIAQSILGEILTERGEFEEAELLLLQAESALVSRRSMPAFHRAAVERLVRLYERWGESEPHRNLAGQLAHWRHAIDQIAAKQQ